MLPKFIKIDSYSVPEDVSLELLVERILNDYPEYEIVGTLTLKQHQKYKYASCSLRRMDLTYADKIFNEITS